MNPEKSEELSALEKIQKLKAQKEEQRQAEEEQQKRIKQEKEQSINSAYETEKAALAAAVARRDEILQRQAEIKEQRGAIIKSGSNAVKEARKDEEVEAILHTTEGFGEIFKGEKAQWGALRQEVDALNNEIATLESEIKEKEKQVSELYAQTPEGEKEIAQKKEEERIQRRNELANQYIQWGYFSIDALKKGNPSPNIVDIGKLETLSPEKREEVVTAIQYVLQKKVEEVYKEENGKNGIQDMADDIARVNEYVGSRMEVMRDLRNFQREAEILRTTRYPELFDHNKEAANIIANYYRNDGEGRNRYLAYSDPTIDEKYLDKVYKEVTQSLDGANPKVPALEPIRGYIAKARAYNKKLVELIEANDNKTIHDIFFKDAEEYFGFSPSVVAYDLKKNYGQELIKHTKQHGLSTEQDLEIQYKHKTALQHNEKQLIDELIASHMTISSSIAEAWALTHEVNPMRTIESNIKTIEENKRDAKSALEKLTRIKEQFADRMDEEVWFEIPEINVSMAVPKLKEEFEKTRQYITEMEASKKLVATYKAEYDDLKNKKLGMFDSKSKHEKALSDAETKLKDETKILNSLQSSIASLRNLPAREDFVRLWRRPGNEQFDFKKEAGLSNRMKLGEMLLDIERYLHTLTEAAASSQEVDILKRFTSARETFDRVSNQLKRTAENNQR